MSANPATAHAPSTEIVYNRAKTWQIGFFVLNNTASNVTLALMGYYAFFTQNVLGLAAVVVGLIATLMRVFDGITDPIFGVIMDKTNTKFGKFRPWMLIGNLILVATVIGIFTTDGSKDTTSKYVITTILYVIYVLGYTMQNTVTKAGQSALTNDPKQRPLFTLFDSIFNAILFNTMTWILTTKLAPTYAGNLTDAQLWRDAVPVFMAVSFLFTVLAVIGIWTKDRQEFWGTGTMDKVKFRDYASILKNNMPLKMLVVAASTDKIGLLAVRSAQVYFFSNILLHSTWNGNYALLALIPSLSITFFGVGWARKTGIKKVYIRATIISIALLVATALLTPVLTQGITPDATLTFNVIALLVVMSLAQGVSGLAGNIVIPMIADCTDYETYRSGKYVPGMIGTIFGFVDKLVSSVSTFIIGAAIAWAGFGNTKIPTNTFLNNKFMIAILFILFGLLILGNTASLIAMKWYHLDGEEMARIQQALHDRKVAAEKAPKA